MAGVVEVGVAVTEEGLAAAYGKKVYGEWTKVSDVGLTGVWLNGSGRVYAHSLDSSCGLTGGSGPGFGEGDAIAAELAFTHFKKR